MADIINFPGAIDRDWREVEQDLKRASKLQPYGMDVLQECLPQIRAAYHKIFKEISIKCELVNTGECFTKEQELSNQAAFDAGYQLLIKQLKDERHEHLAMIIECEIMAAGLRSIENMP